MVRVCGWRLWPAAVKNLEVLAILICCVALLQRQSEEVFASEERVSGFPEEGADLRGSPGNLRGSFGNFRGSLGTSEEPLDCCEVPQ